MAASVEQGLQGPAEASNVSRADAAFADFRATQRYLLEIGELTPALALISSVREYALRAMRYEMFSWADAALAAADVARADFPERTVVTGFQAHGAWLRGEFQRALALASHVAEQEQELGFAPSGLAERVQGNVLFALGALDEGLAATSRLLALAEATGNASRTAHASYMQSAALSSVGRFDEAAELAERTLAIGHVTGSPTDLASGWAATGFAIHHDVPAALEAFATSARIAAEAGNRWMNAFARTEMYGLMLSHGQAGVACAGLADVVDTWFRAGEWSQQWVTLARCVLGLDAIGQQDLAVLVIGAVEARILLGMPPVTAEARDRVLAVRADLRHRLGGGRFDELLATGNTMPVLDVVHRTRAALMAGG